MDPYKLLSRSTKLSKGSSIDGDRKLTPSGQFAQPHNITSAGFGKRKRSHEPEHDIEGFSGFSNEAHFAVTAHSRELSCPIAENGAVDEQPIEIATRLPTNERKRVLKQHKVKVTWLNSGLSPNRTATSKTRPAKALCALYPSPLQALSSLTSQHGVSERLAHNAADQGYNVPTPVQIAALPILLDERNEYIPDPVGSETQNLDGPTHVDLLTVAPTGSGKTLAFMIPLLQSAILRRHRNPRSNRQTSAIILAPTKELASQTTNEGRKLAKGTGVTISQVRKGTKLPTDPNTAKSDLSGIGIDDLVVHENTEVKSDIIVSTPGILSSILEESGNPTWAIYHLVLDEADVLLDPTFRAQTMSIWDRLTEADLRVSLWSATMGSNIEDLVKAKIEDRASRLQTKRDAIVPQAPLIRLVVGLKDSAVPSVSHKLVYAASEKGKLMGLRQLLHPTSSMIESGPTLRPPFLIFTQTVERAIALKSEMLYDVPVEAGGSVRIAVLHSELSDHARDGIMTRFRNGEIWVLITTDLLSRGVDFRGVNGVVNYDIPTSSAAYVHRIGRTGRAGRDGGVAVTLYSKEDIPYLKHVASVVSVSQKQQGEDGGVQQWLLNALPKMGKNEKKQLKRRGIESRTASGQSKDPKAAKKSRISTKAGYIRQAEHKRKGAVLGSQRRSQVDVQDDSGDETEFGGFD